MTWKIKKIYDRGERGVFAHLYNTDPENSEAPDTLAAYVTVSELPKYGLEWAGGNPPKPPDPVTYCRRYEPLKLF